MRTLSTIGGLIAVAFVGSAAAQNPSGRGLALSMAVNQAGTPVRLIAARSTTEMTFEKVRVRNVAAQTVVAVTFGVFVKSRTQAGIAPILVTGSPVTTDIAPQDEQELQPHLIGRARASELLNQLQTPTAAADLGHVASTKAQQQGCNTFSLFYEQVADSWDRDKAFLAGGGSLVLPITRRIEHRTAQLFQITVRPIYAEFDDGSRFGLNVDQRHTCLAKQRHRIVDLYQAIRTTYERSGRASSVLSASLSQTPDLAWLQLLARESGMNAVYEALSKPRKLQP